METTAHFFTRHRTLLALFALALVVRLFFLPFSIFDPKPVVIDRTIQFDGYYTITENLREYGAFSMNSTTLEPDSVRAPVYPYFILFITTFLGGYKALFLVQALLGSIVVVFSWLLAREFLSNRASAVVGVLVALDPLMAYLGGAILTETLFMTFFIPSLLFFVHYLKNKHAGALALSITLLAIATLVKPTTQFLPLGLLLVMAIAFNLRHHTKLLRDGLIVVVLFIAILSPWMMRNYEIFGTTSLVIQPISNLYTYFVPSTIAIERGIPYEDAAQEFFAQEQFDSIDQITLHNGPEYQKRSFEELQKHPLGVVLSAGMTFWTFFTHDSYATILENFGHIQLSYDHPPFSTLFSNPGKALRFGFGLLTRPEGLALGGRVLWIVLSVLFFLGAYLYWRKEGTSPHFLFVMGIVAYFALTSVVIGFAVNGRFRIPIDPVIFIFVVYALETMLQKRPNRHKPVS